MNDDYITEFGFMVRCTNPACTRKDAFLATVYLHDNKRFSDSNPQNQRFCSACGEETIVHCPECNERHMTYEVKNPYVCPTTVTKAIKKLDAALIPIGRWYLTPLVILGILYFVAVWYYFPDVLKAINFEFHAIILLPLFWLIGWVWTFLVNKKRKAQFAKEFPKEWELVQRFPDGLS